MKKILLVGMLVIFLGSVAVFAQEQSDEEMDYKAQMAAENTQIAIDAAMEEVENALDDINVEVLVSRTSESTPKMGVFLSNMDFEDAYKMHYPYCYGVYVTGVTKDGPAQKAGIIKGDIIMEFDGKKAKFEDNLVKLIRSKNIGDNVKVKVFRDEDVLIADLTLATLTPKDSDIIITKDGLKKKIKKKLSVGHGGGGWIPVWFVDDNEFADINHVLDAYGFNGLDEKGILMQGGGGHGNVGKGWFIGGMGAGYSIDKKKGHITEDGEPVTRRMLYTNSYGGVTLDKRIAITKNLVTSLGFMLGWGGHNLQISQTDGAYDWLELNDDMDKSANNAIELEKNYIMFQPKATIMYRIIDWLSIRAEGGYMLSHSYTGGWDAVSCEDNFEIDNSPETPYQGYTISIGPWFGF